MFTVCNPCDITVFRQQPDCCEEQSDDIPQPDCSEEQSDDMSMLIKENKLEKVWY